MKKAAVALVLALALFCASCDIIGPQSFTIEVEETPAASPVLSPEPTPTPLPSPTPTSAPPSPSPTPTPDPDDVFYAKEGEEIVEADPEGGKWLYKSHTLAVEITRVINPEKKWVYYVADIRLRGNETPLAGFSDNKAPGNRQVMPYLIARNYSAVYTQNSDDLTHEDKDKKGIVIRDGVVYLDSDKADTLAFFPDNSMRIFQPGETTADELISAGVKQAYSFGPTLVHEGELNENANKHRVANKNPRSGVGMVEPGHFICIVAEGRQPDYAEGIYMKDFAQIFYDLGCVEAYNMDGGSSSSMVFMGESVNTHIRGAPGLRAAHELLMFGVSDKVPGPKDKVYNTGNRTGELKGEYRDNYIEQQNGGIPAGGAVTPPDVVNPPGVVTPPGVVNPPGVVTPPDVVNPPDVVTPPGGVVAPPNGGLQ